jgi:mannose-1-phosphate guanylyltransferase/mannose-6-phosphate isomerase
VGESSGGPAIIPVILCGGAGTRLWPLSREAHPKQFLPLVDGKSTFAMTLERVADRDLFGRPVIVTGVDHRHLVSDALQEAGVEADILLEPSRRDSAAAVAAAAAFVAQRDPDGIILVLAADHVIRDRVGFRRSVERAWCAAEAGRIVTFGVRPTGPATGFGYIAAGAALADCPGVSAVRAFAEKPNAATAERYIAEGYLWNSGNFMLQASSALAELRRHAPAIAAGAEAAIADVAASGNFIRLPAEKYDAIPANSLDYALMEKTALAAVTEASFDWRDIGSWDAISEASGRDDRGNAVSGPVMLRDSQGCEIHSAGRLVAVLGAQNLLVAADEDAVLVAPRDSLGSLKDFVGEIVRKRGNGGSRAVRPWGYYQVLDGGPGYQVKRIVVDPGARLSLQSHQHRGEHWVVVQGTADVTIGDEIRPVPTGKSVFIPQGALHRLGNSGETTVAIIEVQLGSYLGEDDIVRYEDDYGRTPIKA